MEMNEGLHIDKGQEADDLSHAAPAGLSVKKSIKKWLVQKTHPIIDSGFRYFFQTTQHVDNATLEYNRTQHAALNLQANFDLDLHAMGDKDVCLDPDYYHVSKDYYKKDNAAFGDVDAEFNHLSTDYKSVGPNDNAVKIEMPPIYSVPTLIIVPKM
eukprot:jgi/Psemu1/26186/gm1.26186_g